MSSTKPIHLSPFQKEKLEYYFNFLCPNENGYLDKGSIHRLMEKILDFTGWDENSPTVKKFTEVHDSFFEILFETAVEEEEMDTEGMVTLSRWLSMWSSLLPGAMGMHNLPIWLRLMPEILFKIVDKGGNGYINANDLELFYKEMVHISPETAHQLALKAFDQMTDNGRYQLNETGYEQLFANFLIGRTPYGPGRYIFGVFEHEVTPFELIAPAADSEDTVMAVKKPEFKRRPSRTYMTQLSNS